MVERHLVIVVCACLAVVCTLALAAWISREVPTRVEIGELEGTEVGTLVTVEGRLEGVREAGKGATVLTLEDGSGATVEVFCAFECSDLLPGTILVVTGRLSLYKGDLELVIEEKDGVSVRGGAKNPMVDLADLVEEPWGYEGMEPVVRVKVMVEPVADLNGEDWWCLVGEGADGGAGALALAGPGVRMRLWEPGDELDLRVLVRYDGSSGFVYLEVVEAVPVA
jgi:hypothetical protein